nr:uncharacterized protein LOC128698468 [Cherax quadricarinatus]
MDIDQHLMWFISALKASIDGEAVNDKKLLKNINDCFVRVKKICPSVNKDQYEEFCARATLIMLLCSPRIRDLPRVKTSTEFQTVVVTLPVLPESAFFSIVRSQKSFRFLAPVLSWLSPEVIQELIKQYFLSVEEVTPVTLAITLDLLKVLIFSFQCKGDQKHNMSDMECLKLFLKFVSSKTVSGSKEALIKSSGYYYMYVCEYLYLMLTVCAGQWLKEPDTYKSLQAWKRLWETKVDQAGTQHSFLFVKEVSKSLLLICQLNSESISVDVWMDWNDINLPASLTVHGNSLVHNGKVLQKSIQSVICNIAFDILRIFDSYPEIHESLSMSEYKGLLQFFKQVAADPDYDPDEDLTLDELLHEIRLKDERQAKLLGILIKRDDIFTSQDCQGCLKEFSAVVDGVARQDILLRLIQHNKAGKPYSAELLNLVMDMAAPLPAKQLLAIIEEHLSSGLNETFMTADFSNQLTEVFNQLAGQESLVASERHVWLCLQSGRAVVKQAVTLAVSLSGLVPIMVQALAAIPQVCHALLPTVLLTSHNSRWWLPQELDHKLSVYISQEQMAAASHIRIEGAGVLTAVIYANTIFHSDGWHRHFLCFQEILALNPSTIVRAGPSLVSLIITLVHVLHATANLQSQSALSTLSLRMDATKVLNAIMDNIMCNSEKYEKDISLLKQMIVKYKLHPRSIIPLAPILEAEDCPDTCCDIILHMMLKMDARVQQGEQLSIDTLDNDFKAIFAISRIEWIVALLQVNSGNAYPTLQVFQKVLYLACTQLTLGSVVDDDLETCAVFQGAPVSIQHCFRCFAPAAMVYVEELLQPLACDKRFQSICSIFRWWCRVVSLFQCNPDLPALFLARLCAAVEEMITCRKLKISKKNVKQTDPCEEKQSNLIAAEGSLLQNDDSKDIVDKENHVVNGKEKLHSSETGDESQENEENSLNLHSDLELHNGFQAVNTEEVTVANGKRENSVLSTETVGVCEVQAGACNGFTEVSPYQTQDNNCVENIVFDDLKITSCNNVSSKKKKKKNKIVNKGVKISFADFKREIEQMIFSLVKYVPVSNLVSCIGNKLKKLDEL